MVRTAFRRNEFGFDEHIDLATARRQFHVAVAILACFGVACGVVLLV